MRKSEQDQGLDRTSAGLREAMFELLEGLRNGTVKPREARLQCEVADRIVGTVKMELAELRAIREGIKIQAETIQLESSTRGLLGDGSQR